jgi:hypothetical protein
MRRRHIGPAAPRPDARRKRTSGPTLDLRDLNAKRRHFFDQAPLESFCAGGDHGYGSTSIEMYPPEGATD